MWDKKAILSFTMLGINVGIYNLYLYELFYGTWRQTNTRGMYYIVTAMVLSYLTYDTIKGYSTSLHLQGNITIFLALIINFLLFALTLYDILPNHRLYLYTFNGTLLAATIVILILGRYYEMFKI